MLSNTQMERAPRWQADALSSVAAIEDALLNASVEVTRELQARWPAGKSAVARSAREAYRKLARRRRLVDAALAAPARLRKQLLRGPAPQDQPPQPPRTNGASHHDADSAIAAAI